jgi:hypothetical protein
MQSNVDKLPTRYFLKRLTKFARKDLHFDRNDVKMQGPNGETQRYRHTTMMREAMAVVRAGTMSSAGFQRGLGVIKELRKQLERIPADIGPNKVANTTPARQPYPLTTMLTYSMETQQQQYIIVVSQIQGLRSKFMHLLYTDDKQV